MTKLQTMLRTPKYWALFGALFIAIVLTQWVELPSSKAQTTNLTQAPDFKASGHDDKTYQLKDFKGKWVVLEWYNNLCPYVNKHYASQNMQKLQKKYTDKGVVWFSVASSKEGKQGYLNQERAKNVIKERDSHPTAILLDASGSLARAYHATSTPHMFVIDPNGNIVYQGAIDDQPSFRESSLENARNFVAEALDIGLGIDEKKRTKVEVSTFPVYGCSIKNDLNIES